MLNPATLRPKSRMHLSFDPLIQQICLRAEQLPVTHALADCTYSVADALMSGLALFSLSDSLASLSRKSTQLT